jgi:hypothetical protein
MDQNYTIDEILIAVSDLYNKKKERKTGKFKNNKIDKNNSGIPKNTLKLIEEAEKIKN